MKTGAALAGGVLRRVVVETAVMRANVDCDLRLVARRQRFLIWCIVLAMLFNCTMTFGFPSFCRSPAMHGPGVLVSLALHVCFVVGLVMSMSALQRHAVWIVISTLFMFVPLINLLILLSVNGQATRRLKAAGVKVGLMGASDEMVRRAISPFVCRQCGYDLTGNTSGVCPECGRRPSRARTCGRCGWVVLAHAPDKYCARCGFDVVSG